MSTEPEPLPPGETSASPEPTEPATGAEPETPEQSGYKNLWLPLVVVPALVVIGMVLVFLFFGAFSGAEKGLSQNLSKVVSGGANERMQALFSLSQQVAENLSARAEGRPEPYPVPPGFGAEVSAAFDQVPPERARMRLVLANLLVRFEDERGMPALYELLELGEALDPEGDVRLETIISLGLIGDPVAAPRLIAQLDAPLSRLRSGAAVSLQRMPSEPVREGLRGALADSDLLVRANAAISLSHQGDNSGADLLRNLTQEQPYIDENQRNSARFKRETERQDARMKAAEALARLDRPEDRAFFEQLVSGEQPLAVREVALRYLDSRAGD